MRLKPIFWETGLSFTQALIYLALVSLFVGGCGPKKQALSPEATAFKREISSLLHRLQHTLADPLARGDIPAMDEILRGLSKENVDICVDCPYRAGVLNKDGVVVTTYPKNEFIGRDFSSYKIISEPLAKQRITQRQTFQADGSKNYYVSAPVVKDNRVIGVVVLALTPNDIGKKWRLTEEEFLAIDFNAP